jgi:hypothetical protein
MRLAVVMLPQDHRRLKGEGKSCKNRISWLTGLVRIVCTHSLRSIVVRWVRERIS